MSHQRNNELLRIGAAATYLNISIKTLRRWEDRGLIKPLRNPQNQRLYASDQLKSLKSRKYQPLPHVKSADNKSYTISQTANLLGVSIKTVRRWDQAGKIEGQRNSRNQRVFTFQSIQNAKQLQAQKEYAQPEHHIPPSPTPSPQSPPSTHPNRSSSYQVALICLLFLVPIFSIFTSVKLSKQENIADSPSDSLIALSPDSQTPLNQNLDQIYPDLPNNIPNQINSSLSSGVISQDIEITKPMNTEDLIDFINRTSPRTTKLTDIGTQYSFDQAKKPTSPITLYPIFSDYLKHIPLSNSNSPLSVSAIFRSPSGDNIVKQASIDLENQSYLIRFVPDQVGTWNVTWQTTDQSIVGSDTFQVIQN